MPLSEDLPLALVVDDDEVFRNRLCRALAQRNWEAEAAPGADEALKFVRERSPDLVLLDLRMPGKGGLDVVEELRSIDSSMTIIVLTGYGSIPTAISAMKRGADHYLSKPADADQILAVYEGLESAPTAAPDAPETVPTLARVEWEHMQRVLSDCNGNISLAARLLGIHRRSLQRKLSKYPPAR
jgi:two-component system response regulator RegA